MPITDINSISTGAQFPPHEEIAMTNYVSKWRRLYEGDFSALQLPEISNEIPGYGINWFRRIATFYGEFMFGDRPEIYIEGNPTMQNEVAEFATTMFPQLQIANVDMIRFGKGIMATHPMDAMRFVRFERDQQFQVQDIQGMVIGDVLYRVRNQELPDEEHHGLSKTADVYKYPVDGEGTWEVYSYNKGGLGRLMASFPTTPRAGRQVVEFQINADSTSLFEDIQFLVAEMSRNLSRMGYSIKRNLRPHLVAPSGSLITEDGNAVRVNEQGMIFPVQEGDPMPMYLQWDGNQSSMEWYYNNLKANMFNMVGVSELMFDASLFPGELSGEALRRMMLAFWSKLNHIKAINNEAIEKMLDIWNANRMANNMEVFDFDRSDIEISWGWEELFMNTLETDQDVGEDEEPAPA